MCSSVGSWDGIRDQVRRTSGDENMAALLLGEAADEHGRLRPPNTRDGSLRLFGAGPADVQVVLYRDPAYWCPYCQRVQLQLEYKRVPYSMRMINMRCYGAKPQYYLRKVPSGLLPAVELNGRLITESVDIMLDIEEAFPDRTSLVPSRREDLLRKLMGLERDCFALWCGWLFRPFGGDRARDGFVRAMRAWCDALERIDRSGPFLLGSQVCLVDIMAAPFFERYAATTKYWKGYQLRQEFPAIDSWMSALETEVDSFATTKADDFSTVHDIPPQYGNAYYGPSAERLQRSIDGLDGSWEVEAVADSSCDRLEAAAAVVRGGEKLVKFALRGVGKRPRTVTAPLADPDAVPDEQLAQEMDAALRIIAEALLVGAGSGDEASIAADISGSETVKMRLATCLAYLRDRIGVPRDMSAGAALQLRAYINWFNRAMLGDRAWDNVRASLSVAKA